MEDTPARKRGRPKKPVTESGKDDKGRFFAEQYQNSQLKLKAANEEIKSLKEENYQLKKGRQGDAPNQDDSSKQLAELRETNEKLLELLNENELKLKQYVLDNSNLEKTVTLARNRIKELEYIEDNHFIEPIVHYTNNPNHDHTELIKGLCHFITLNSKQGGNQDEKDTVDTIRTQTL